MTREQQVNKLLAPMYAAITKDIAVTLDYAPYVMDGLIGPKLSEFEKGVIEEHITSYVTQNQKKMMGSDFDEISNEMCEHLISSASAICDVVYARTSAVFVPPPPPPPI
jgi:hypothetical protein